MTRKIFFFIAILMGGMGVVASRLQAQTSKTIVDRVVWIVGDEPILLSDIEYQKIRFQSEGVPLDKKPDCFVPEKIAVQMLFLDEAELDSIKVDETMLNRRVEAYLESLVAQVGSKEKLAEYFGKPYSQIKEDQRRQARNQDIVSSMQQSLVKDIQVTPSDIRAYYKSMPQDSLPFINTKVEVKVIVRKPEVRLTETDRIKSKLRSFAESINKGETTFSSLARLYSEDKRTSANGGEYGFVAKNSLEPEFARIVFNMSSSQKVSPIIQTEEGYHIVQLIEKKGDMINFRHILLRPNVTNEALEQQVAKLDSIAAKIRNKELSFEDAVSEYSQDEKTINNGGLMVNENYSSPLVGSSEFTLEELPQDISRTVDNMKPGDISQAFISYNDKGIRQVMIIKLENREEAHRANIQSDFQTIKDLALHKKQQEFLDAWIREKQLKTFVEIAPEYQHCDFEYPGWIHDNN